MNQCAQMYQELRALKKRIEERHETELEKVNAAMEGLRNYMLDQLLRAGSNSMRTDKGTVYKSVIPTYSMADPAAFREWVDETGNTDFFVNALSKEAVENYMNAGNNLPPGLKVSTRINLNVTK